MFHASYEPRILITNAIEQSLEGFWWLVSGNRARPVIGTLPYVVCAQTFGYCCLLSGPVSSIFTVQNI